MRLSFPAAIAVGVLCWIVVVVPTVSHAATTCGDGIVSGGEECDAGGNLFIDGDPAKGACSTGSRCYFQFTCCKFNCQFVGTPAVPCEDGDSCSGPDTCDQVGACRSGAAAPEATPCDDGIFCNGTESCRQGKCGSHTGSPCPETACNTCQEASDSCFTPAGTAPCNDSVCTSGGICDGSGTCIDGVLNAGPCDDGLYCNGEDNCSGGACSVHSGDPCTQSQDGDNDCVESCDEAADSCTAPDEDGAACDNALFCDGDADVCEAGVCAGTGSVACDDGNPCTVEMCDDSIDSCTWLGPSQDGTICGDRDPCTLDDVCVAGVCRGSRPQMEDFCRWTVVVGEDPGGDLIKTGVGATIDGDVCGGTLLLSGRTAISSDVVCDESTGFHLRIAPDATVGGDLVSAGAGAKAYPASGILPYTLSSVLGPGMAQEKDDSSGVYELSGYYPLLDDCDVVRESYSATAEALDLLPATTTLSAQKLLPGTTARITAANPGALNVLHVAGGIKLGKHAVLELDGGGDPSTVIVLRIDGKLDMKLDSSLSPVGGLTTNHLLVYVRGTRCKFGDLVLGGGTLFCSPGRVKAQRLFAWVGAIFGDGKRLRLGDSTGIHYEPFTGF